MTQARTPFDGKAFVRGLSTAPGVYRMLAADDSAVHAGPASIFRARSGVRSPSLTSSGVAGVPK